MPLFWDNPYRSPYDDALTAYNRVRRERDSFLGSFFSSRWSVALLSLVGPLLIFGAYLIWTDYYKLVTEIPASVRNINTNLKSALNKTLLLEGHLRDVRLDLGTVKAGLDTASMEIANARGDLGHIDTNLGTARTEIEAALKRAESAIATASTNVNTVGSGVTTLDQKIDGLQEDLTTRHETTQGQIGNIEKLVAETAFQITGLRANASVVREDREQAFMLVGPDIASPAIFAKWIAPAGIAEGTPVLLLVQIGANHRTVAGVWQTPGEDLVRSKPDETLVLSQGLAAELGVTGDTKVESVTLVVYKPPARSR